MNKTILKIRQDAEALLADANAKREELTEKISSAKSMEIKATEEMEAAYAAADTRAYHRSQDGLRSAQDAQKMYNAQLNRLNSEQLIDKEIFDARCSSIMAELDSAKAEASKKIVDLIEQMQPIAAEYKNLVDFANETMLLLQEKIYKDPEFLKATEVLQQHKMVAYKNMAPSSFVYYLTKLPFYTENAERSDNHE